MVTVATKKALGYEEIPEITQKENKADKVVSTPGNRASTDTDFRWFITGYIHLTLPNSDYRPGFW